MKGLKLKSKFMTLAILFISLCFLLSGGIILVNNKSTLAQESQNEIEVISANDKRLGSSYLDFYAISSSQFSYSNNGGELSGNALSKAFDRDESTFFKSAQDNNVSYTDEDGQTKENFINTIDVVFDNEVSINRVFYGSETGMTRGYPVVLNIYSSTDGQNFSLIKTYTSSETTNIVSFNFGKTITVKAIRFEYVKVYTGHKYCATAREIMFLQEENDSYEDFENLFSSYNQLSLNYPYNSIKRLTVLEAKLSQNANFSTTIKDSIDRAKAICTGQISFSSKREFSTDPNAENVIGQYGDVPNYAQKVYKMSSFGTNRQVTGIATKEGEKITVYVDAKEGDPLPKLYFSQTENYYNGWLSERALKIGKNTFTTPNLKNSNYTREVVTGGALYFVNPYTNDKQSQNIKIYIEGGDLFPVYKKGEDEESYKEFLVSYYENWKNDKENYFDLTELVSDHIVLTLTCEGAYNYYITQGYSPKNAMNNWDEYLTLLLEFGGVTFDTKNENYNPIHEHLNTNIRIVQVFAGAAAYAFYEHIGIYRSWESTALTGSGFGWGYSHELGHMFDIADRTIGECSNNMWAKYYETAIAKTATRGEFDKTLQTLSPDEEQSSSYFNSNRYNFLVWWYIETYHKGYWGEVENCYRGINSTLKKYLALDRSLQQKINSLSRTERQIFYTNLVVGIDLSYYFDRWGYSLTGEEEDVFKIENASETFKELVSLAEKNRFVSDKVAPKLWLQDRTQYNEVSTISKPLYSGKENVKIEKVFKSSTGYTLLLENEDDSRFMGYEIYRANESGEFEVIGFAKDFVFFDENQLSYNPSYKIVGVDRLYNYSKFSKTVSPQAESTNVCKIGQTYYDSLLLAVENASDGDEIVLLKNVESSNLTISKNLTITVESSQTNNLFVYRIDKGDFITIDSGVTLTINGNENAHIVFDGNSFSQSGALFKVQGVIKTNYVDFQNNKNTSYGTIVFLTGNKSYKNTLTNGKMSNNKATYGGGIYSDNANNVLEITNFSFDNNSVSNNGSAIVSRGTITLNDCQFLNNYATGNGTIYNHSGGILYSNNVAVKNNTANCGGGYYIDGATIITGGVIKNNVALSNGGGIYYSTSTGVRTLTLKNVQILDNKASVGSEIYANGITVNISSVVLSGQSLRLEKGDLNIDSTSKIECVLEYNSGKITLQNEIFENSQNCKINVLNPVKDMIVVYASGFKFDQENIKQISLYADHMTLALNPENNSVAILDFQPLKVVLVDSDGTIIDSFLIEYNHTLKLPNHKKEDFEGWLVDDKIVKPNQEITVLKNLTIVASYKQVSMALKISVIVLTSLALITIISLLVVIIRQNKYKKYEKEAEI